MNLKRFAFFASFYGHVQVIGECMGVDKQDATEHAYTQLLDAHPRLWPCTHIVLT